MAFPQLAVNCSTMSQFSIQKPFTKFGFFGGSQKFAALMNVLNYAIRLKHNFDQMLTYIRVFYTKCDAPFKPKVMKTI
jgi:hypothetical protein